MTDNQPGWSIDFDASDIERSALLGVLLAPVIPEFWAQTLWLGMMSFLAVVHLGVLAMLRAKRISLPQPESASRRFETSGQTILLLNVIVAWLGSAGLLWTFESFVVMTATIHSVNTTIGAFIGYEENPS